MTLSVKQERAVNYLLSGETKVKTAQLVKVNPKTISQWMKKDEFLDEIKRQNKKYFGGRLSELSRNMFDLALNKKYSPQTRFLATQDLMNRIGVGVEYEDTDEDKIVDISAVFIEAMNED
jgi:hypothetical protein